MKDLVAQRVFGLAMGYEDLNDHDDLRCDFLMAVALGKTDLIGERRVRERDRGKGLAKLDVDTEDWHVSTREFLSDTAARTLRRRASRWGLDWGSVLSDPASPRAHLHVCYEAGPTGYGLEWSSWHGR